MIKSSSPLGAQWIEHLHVQQCVENIQTGVSTKTSKHVNEQQIIG